MLHPKPGPGKKKELRHTPISALTANVIKGVKERGLLIGYDTFLGKPIILKELEKLLSNYLKSAQSSDTQSVNKDISVGEKREHNDKIVKRDTGGDC